MKNSIYLVLAFSVLSLISCTKEDPVEGSDGLVKTIDSVVMDTQIGMIQLDDGNFVVVSNGELVKLNDNGTILWRKPITEISITRAATAEPGSGFVLFGVPTHPLTVTSFNACRYDLDGNLIYTKQVNLNFPNNYVELPASIIRLANGGFAVAMPSPYTWSSYLKILDHDFNLVYSSVIAPPAGYWNFIVHHICEMPGGDIAMVATISNGDNNVSWINNVFLITTPNGNIRSFVVRGDTTFSHIAQTVSTCDGGFFSASSVMNGWMTNIGTIVNYYAGSQIAGRIQIDRFNSEGQFMGSRQLTGYSGYGVIKSIRKTYDGGYLLCGTADNNGSNISVSMTKVFVCKLDAGLNEIWSKTFNTTYQAIGCDAVPISDGACIVSGNMKSFGSVYQMLMIKTDANGRY